MSKSILKAKPVPTPDGRVLVIDHEATKKYGRTYYKWVPATPTANEVGK